MSDELAEINGIKPNVSLADGEVHEVGSQSSKSVYKVKRTFDHYYCSCPSAVPVNARTCKHLKAFLGEEYENARIQLKNPDGPPPKATKAKAPPKSKGASGPATKSRQAGSKRKKGDEEGIDDEEGEENPQPPPPKRGRTAVNASRAATTSKKAATKGKGRKQKEEDMDVDEDEDDGEEKEEVPDKRGRGKAAAKASKPSGKKVPARKETPDNEEDEEDEDVAAPEPDLTSGDANDILASIDGIKPAVYIKDGEEREAKSQSSNTIYKVKRTFDHFYCTCPAWRNQGGVPVNARTCKHLKSLLGEKYEAARIKRQNPNGPAPAPAKAAKAKGRKITAVDEEDGEDGDNDVVASGKNVPGLLLAVKWDLEKGSDPTGWWVSEKLDGVRSYFDGTKFISRLGNPFAAPQWFLDLLPTDIALDGELYGGRGNFQDTVSIVKTVNSPHWKKITFQIFDVPSRGEESFEERYAFLHKTFGKGGMYASEHIVVVEQTEAKSREHVLQQLKDVESLGGEGLMLRKAGSTYEGCRSSTLQKIKTFYDAEAIVTGYADGKGKNKGITGALKCKMESGKTFNVGTGLSDKQRRNPPKIGSIITYRFQELTRDGVPRFPSFVGVAADKDQPKDAEIPEHKKAAMVASGSGDA